MVARNARSPSRGVVAVFLALALIPLLFLVGIVLDGGLLMSQMRQTQAVADAAAYAGACSLASNYATNSGTDPKGTAKAAALGIASDNGYTNDGTTSSITVNIPPKTGLFIGKSGDVEVLVTYYQVRYFSAMMGTGNLPVSARAVGRVVSTTPSSILLTDPSSSGALTLTGGARLTATGTIQVNSNSPSAVVASNGAYATDSGGMSIVGGYNIPSYATSSTFFSNVPLTSQASVSDPNSTLSPPSTSSLGPGKGPALPYGTNTMSPGVFSGGITLGGGSTITMNPGIYYMQNGGFTVANGVNLTGTGVVIYMDSSGGALSFQGGTTIHLSPPTSGPYSGIVYYQDRANNSTLNNIANGANVTMTGTLYAPNATMTIAGGASGSSYGSQFIVKSLNLSNGVNVSINTSASSNPIPSPFLAE